MKCKTCRLLGGLAPDDAEYLNSALLAGLITAAAAQRILEKHSEPISVTSVRVHRSADHRDITDPG